MITVHDIFGKTQFFRECEPSDMLVHFQKIKHWIPEEEHLSFQRRMDACISAGKAYVMQNGNAFLYYIPIDEYVAHGVALFGKDNAVDMLTLFIGIFGYVDTKTFTLKFNLHPDKFVPEYKCMLTEVSIRRNARDNSHPLVVRIDKIKAKCNKLFKARGYE